MANALRKLLIDNKELTPRQASELPRAATEAAIKKRMITKRSWSDHEIVFNVMLTKSQSGKIGSRNSPFNSGNQRPAGQQ